MIDLLPMTPFSIAGTAALFGACAFALHRDRALWPLVAIMLTNWLATRAVSAFHLSGAIQAIADLSSAALLLLPQKRAGVAVPVAALFAGMVAFSAVFDSGLIGRNTLWAWSDVLGYCQLLLFLGAAAASGGGGRLAVDLSWGGRNLGLVRPLARWLSGPPAA